MSMRTLALANMVLVAVASAMRENVEISSGGLDAFNSGIGHLLETGREPSDAEVAALTQLAEAVVPNFADVEVAAEELGSEPGDATAAVPTPAPVDVTPSDPAAPAPVDTSTGGGAADPSVGAPASEAEGEGQPSGDEVTQPPAEASASAPSAPVDTPPADPTAPASDPVADTATDSSAADPAQLTDPAQPDPLAGDGAPVTTEALFDGGGSEPAADPGTTPSPSADV